MAIHHSLQRNLFYLILMACIWGNKGSAFSPHLTDSTRNFSDWFRLRRPVWRKVVDFQGIPPYHYQRKYKHIGRTTVNTRLDISFEFEMDPRRIEERDYLNVPILIFDGNDTRLTLYMNDWRGFGISHCDQTQRKRTRGFFGVQFTEPPKPDKSWLYTEHSGIPKVASDPDAESPLTRRQRGSYYHIQFLNTIKVSVSINGLAVSKWIDTPICAKGDIMDIVLDDDDFAVDGSIRNLVIKAI